MKSTILALCVLLAQPHLVEANERSTTVSKHRTASLPDGATPNQVRLLWGDPVEKSLREVKGELVWRYEDTQLIFRNGKLLSAPHSSHPGTQETAGQEHLHKTTPARLHVLPPQKVPPSKIFKEIMEVYGEEGGTPAPAPTPFGMPGQFGGRESPVMPLPLQGDQEMEKGPMIE